jgi:hypothetical protein
MSCCTNAGACRRGLARQVAEIVGASWYHVCMIAEGRKDIERGDCVTLADPIEECETLYECQTGRAPPEEVEPSSALA